MELKILKTFKNVLLAGTLYQILTYALGLLCAGFVSRVLELAIEKQWSAMKKTVVIAAVCIAMSSILIEWVDRVCSKKRQDSLQNYREMICKKTIRKEISISNSGELDVRLQGDAETIAGYYSDSCPRMLAAGLTVAACSVILWNCDRWLAIIFGGLGLLQLLPTLLYEKWAKAIYLQTMQNEEDYCNWIKEGLNGISTIKSCQQENWFLKRFRQYNHAVVKAGIREARTATVEDIITELIGAILSYGSYLILGGFILFRGMEISRVPLLLVLLQYLFSAVAVIVKSRVAGFKCHQAIARLGNVTEYSGESEKEVCEMPIVVWAENISKTYEEKRVLSGISIKIEKGDRIRLLGTNGAGKTTLLRILAGCCKPDYGSVLQRAGTIAFSFQEEPELNVAADEIVDALAEKGVIKREKFLRHICGFKNMEILSRIPKECSAGQQKKFYLAIALSRNAEFLILDEPTNHLDAEGIFYLQEQLKNYSGTLLVCTHDEHLTLPWNKEYRIREGMLYEV